MVSDAVTMGESADQVFTDTRPADQQGIGGSIPTAPLLKGVTW